MGVPKFFRWISERYPCLSELVREYQIPEFDNLYLDMNGIIHMCSHPNDFDPHFRITEEKMFQDIFHYIEILFRMIKPQKLFFLAVDGVAPRAKMNQQRGRRFRSAKEAEILEQKARERGEELPAEERFDSNCITPGTVFMARLHEQLKYFVTYKVSTDRQWQKIKVILSGHETPGEGEHKIMDYIRYMKSQPGYDPNTRHCLYGLDADLIMLGLCSHEPHFSLLREEVKYRKTKQSQQQQQQRTTTPEETRFFLLHLSLMREYLKLEFQELKDNESFKFDIEKIIDDWVLMGFLVGNDFIPPLPDMHITTGALPTLYEAYIEIFPTLGGYINEAGTLNLKRFKKYMEKLSAFDVDKFRDTYADIKYIETKTGQQFGSPNEKKTGRKGSLCGEPLKKSELEALIRMTNAEFQGSEEENDQELSISSEEDFDTDDEDLFYTHFKQHKRDYYMNKMEYAIVDREVLRSQADGYVKAIQWNLHYYYNGVCSWSWFYPHHYAPYISDICNFSDNVELHFDLGVPFLPFQQLLAVLPAASKNLLPKAYQELMVNETSPILHFYPSEFRTDLNGKKHEWEAVVLIPFIDEKSLLSAMEPYVPLLTPEDKKRNTHGPMVIYTYTEEDLGVFEAPEYFPPLHHNHAAKLEMMRDELHVAQSCLVKGLCPGVQLDVYFPGFPTLNHIPHVAFLKKMRVKVFEHSSQGYNMILRITDQGKPDIKKVAKDLLGEEVYVSWPHLAAARVISVSNRDFQYGLMSDSAGQQTLEVKPNSPALWNAQRSGIKERYLERRGVEIGDTNILVTAVLLIGRKYIFSASGKITLEKQWSELPTQFALQTTVRGIPVQEQKFAEYKSIQEVFPPKAVCFMLGHPHYGAMGEVLESGLEVKAGRVKVNMKVTPEPHLGDIHKHHQDSIIQYMSANQAAQYLGISSHLVSRVTGTIYVVLADKHQGSDFGPKVNVGLNLKFSKRNEEVPGYARKDGTMWQYSVKAVDLLRNYLAKFPDVLNYLAHHTGNDIFYATEIFPKDDCDEAISKVNEVADWLKDQPHNKVERNLCGAEVVDPEVVQALEHVVDEFNVQHRSRIKTVIMQVKPHLLFKPSVHIGTMAPDGSVTHKLFDRIVNVRECFTVPLGLKGTIIGMRQTEKDGDPMYDVLFDKPFPGGLIIGCSAMRGYRVPGSSFLNLSHGQRIEQIKTGNKPTAVVNPSENGIIQNRCIYLPRNSYPPSAFATWNNNAQQPVRSTSYVPSTNNTSSNFRNMPQSVQRNENMVQSQFLVSSFSPQQQSGPGGRKPRYQQNIVPTKPQVLPSQPNSTVQLNKNISSSSSTEFQALWACLQKASENVQHETKQHDGLVPQLVPVNGSEEVPDKNGTEVLKKMLRIADRVSPESVQPRQSSPITILARKKQTSPQAQVQHNPQLPSQTAQQQLTPQLQSIKKVSVEDIFKHAKNIEPTPVKKDGPSYCMQLLQIFQAKGLGIPRYNYITNTDDGSMTARVILPDMLAFTGTRAFTREEASESAARLAFTHLSLDKGQNNMYSYKTHHSQNGSGANTGFLAGKPGTNKLPVPPQQWYNQQQFRGYRFNRQGDWWRGADIVQQQYNCQQQPTHQDLSTVGRSQQYTSYPQASPNQFWQGPVNTGNWKQQPQQQQQHQPGQMKMQVQRPSVEESQCQFVPLQAVKQQRNKAGGIASNSPQQAQEVELTQQMQQNLSVSERKQTINKETQSVQATPSSVTLKPLVVRPRKCRLAANFNVKPAAEY